MRDRGSGVGVLRRVNQLHGGGASSDGCTRCARSEGHACRARRSGMDRQTLFGGPDKQVPPRARDFSLAAQIDALEEPAA